MRLCSANRCVPLDGTWYICISSLADAFLVALQVDPVHNNVAFTSAQSGWSFTLQSFAQLYADVFGTAFDTTEFARRLWGDVYFHPDSESGIVRRACSTCAVQHALIVRPGLNLIVACAHIDADLP
jgi:hypothetical protein